MINILGIVTLDYERLPKILKGQRSEKSVRNMPFKLYLARKFATFFQFGKEVAVNISNIQPVS